MVEALRRGDQVVTSGGLIGKVTKVDDRRGRGRAGAQRQGAGGQVDHQPGDQQDRARRGLRRRARPRPGRAEDIRRRHGQLPALEAPAGHRHLPDRHHHRAAQLLLRPGRARQRRARGGRARRGADAGDASTTWRAGRRGCRRGWSTSDSTCAAARTCWCRSRPQNVHAEQLEGLWPDAARQAARPARPGRQRAAARHRAGGAAHPHRQSRRHGRGARRRRTRWRRPVFSITGASAASSRPRADGDAAGRDADRRAEDGARPAHHAAEPRDHPPPRRRGGHARAVDPAPGRRPHPRAGAGRRLGRGAAADHRHRPRGCPSTPVVNRTTDSERAAGARPGGAAVRWTSRASSTCSSKRSVVTGEQLVDSQPSFDQNGRPAVTFRFNPSGGAAFGEYTAENIGKPFAIVLDNQVISAPTIQTHIAGGSGIITGNFTAEESTRLADPAARRRAAGRDQGARAADDRAGARRRTSINAGGISAVVAFAARHRPSWC